MKGIRPNTHTEHGSDTFASFGFPDALDSRRAVRSVCSVGWESLPAASWLQGRIRGRRPGLRVSGRASLQSMVFPGPVPMPYGMYAPWRVRVSRRSMPPAGLPGKGERTGGTGAGRACPAVGGAKAPSYFPGARSRRTGIAL